MCEACSKLDWNHEPAYTPAPWVYIDRPEDDICPGCGNKWADIHGVMGCRMCLLAENIEED